MQIWNAVQFPAKMACRSKPSRTKSKPCRASARSCSSGCSILGLSNHRTQEANGKPAHRALADAYETARLLVHLLGDVASRQQSSNAPPWDLPALLKWVTLLCAMVWAASIQTGMPA